MFKCGDAVMYGSSGACKITAETTREYLGKEAACFILEPIFGGSMKIYLPISNEKLMSKMRYMLTQDEAMHLIKNLPETGEEYIENDNLRRQKYSELLNLCETTTTTKILKTLYEKKLEKEENKKRLHQCDERLLKEATRIFCDEIAFVFGITPPEVHEFILSNK